MERLDVVQLLADADELDRFARDALGAQRRVMAQRQYRNTLELVNRAEPY